MARFIVLNIKPTCDSFELDILCRPSQEAGRWPHCCSLCIHRVAQFCLRLAILGGNLAHQGMSTSSKGKFRPLGRCLCTGRVFPPPLPRVLPQVTAMAPESATTDGGRPRAQSWACTALVLVDPWTLSASTIPLLCYPTPIFGVWERDEERDTGSKGLIAGTV